MSRTTPQSGYAPVNGLQLYYEIHGTGQPLVVLHGAFMTIELLGDLVPGLARSRQVIAVASSVTCAETPIQTRPFPGPLGGLRWIVARPVSAGITGHLFYGQTAHGPAAALHIHGTMPDGGTTKILWVIRTGAVGPVLVITGHNRTGAGRTHQAFPAASGGGVAGTPYPSIIDVPTPGCWQVRLQSGQVKGTVTMRVVR